MYDCSFNRHCEALGQEPLHGNSLLAWTRAERTVVLLSRHYFGDEPDDWPEWQLGGFSHWAGPRNQQMLEILKACGFAPASEQQGETMRLVKPLSGKEEYAIPAWLAQKS